VILVLGSPHDTLANELSKSLQAQGTPFCFVDEEQLFTQVAFSLERQDRLWNGFIRIAEDPIALDDISGVLMRLPRQWWPSPSFDLQDQMFVYHETTSAWFNLLTNLSCPVVNRFGLGWWLRDTTYPEVLSKCLSETLQLGLGTCNPFDNQSGGSLPSLAPTENGIYSVYVVGKNLIERSCGTVHIETSVAAPITSLLKDKASQLQQWQDETGISLCRLDFDCRGEMALTRVEAFPLLNNEPDHIRAKLISATMELLQ
jgi:hypothetical protein